MVKKFQIAISQSPQQAFHPGSELRGTLTVEVGEPRGFHYIKVSLISKAHAFIKINDAACTATDTRKYINEQTIVWHWEQARDGRLQSGRHTFPFQFTIPNEQLPSSVEYTTIEEGSSSSFGYIQYYVEGRIGTDQPEFDHLTKAPFRLVEVVDINNVPDLQRPIGGELQKTVHSRFRASDKITARAEIPRRGYCIGEIIPLTVTVDNASTKQIRVAVYLQQVLTYRAEARKCFSHREILHLTSETMHRRIFLWRPGSRLRVPQTVPTNTSCSIVTVEYVLVVETLIPSANKRSIEIPLTIGNVPLREVSSPAPPPEVPPMISSQPQPSAPAYIPQPRPPTSYPRPLSELTSCPPPSYEPTLDPPPSYKPTSHPQPSHGPTSDSPPSYKPTSHPQPSHGPTSDPPPSYEPTSHPQPSHGPTSVPPPSYELTSDPPPSYELALQL